MRRCSTRCWPATTAPKTLPRAVGIYERDGGLLWKHYDVYSQQNQSRRARQLVVFFIATIGNYDYAINWIFHQDGVIEVDAALTGIMLPKGVKAIKAGDHYGVHRSGHLVAANVAAPHHQHFFNFRLDFDVDGTNNSVREMNTRAAAPSRDNPSLNQMIMEETELPTERRTPRSMDLESSRHWLVVNASMRNALGHQSSYILVPGANALPYVAPNSPVRQRAQFINHHFWATRYDATELHAAGPYPNQSRSGDGLPRWIADDEPLVNQDVSTARRMAGHAGGARRLPAHSCGLLLPESRLGRAGMPDARGVPVSRHARSLSRSSQSQSGARRAAMSEPITETDERDVRLVAGRKSCAQVEEPVPPLMRSRRIP